MGRMPRYRDDTDALRFQKERLAEDLQQAEAELQQQRSAATAAEGELRAQSAQLAAKEAELAALRQKLAGQQPASTGQAAVGEVRCPSCGKSNQAHYKFCLGCGTDLQGAPPAPMASPAANFNLAPAAPPAANARAVIVVVATLVLFGVIAAVYLLTAF